MAGSGACSKEMYIFGEDVVKTAACRPETGLVWQGGFMTAGGRAERERQQGGLLREKPHGMDGGQEDGGDGPAFSAPRRGESVTASGPLPGNT